MSLKTLDQKRAEHAWNTVAKICDDKNKKEFATVCKQTAARILNAGLAGALAFSQSRGDDKHRAVVKALEKYLSTLPLGGSTNTTYLERLLDSDAITLRRHTEEALALLVWLARLADGAALKEERNHGKGGSKP